MTRTDSREERKRMFGEKERTLKDSQVPAVDGMFYYHAYEERIMLSYAVLAKNLIK